MFPQMALRQLMLSVTFLHLLASGATAQENGPSGGAEDQETTAILAEEITVTAERREENAQDVGVTITVVPRSEIEDLGLHQPADVAARSANLDIKQTFGNSNPVITIRGVGLNDFNPNNNSPAGVYLDEVYLTSTSMMSFQLFDTERIEVLKGPQGTLYGRNTTAGAINVITRKPSPQKDGRLALGYSSFETLELDAALGGGFSERVFGRLALTARQGSGGPFFNRFLNEEYGATDVFSWRGMLDLRPRDNLSILLNVHGSRDRSEGYYYEHLGFLDPLTFGPCAAFLEGRIDPETCLDLGLYSDPDGDPFVGDYDLRPFLDHEALGAAVTVSWVQESFTLTSVTGYEAFDRRQSEDADASPLAGLNSTYNNRIQPVFAGATADVQPPAQDRPSDLLGLDRRRLLLDR